MLLIRPLYGVAVMFKVRLNDRPGWSLREPPLRKRKMVQWTSSIMIGITNGSSNSDVDNSQHYQIFLHIIPQSTLLYTLQDSNLRHPPCKRGALPTELKVHLPPDLILAPNVVRLQTVTVIPPRLELGTPSLKVRCSSQLSYEIIFFQHVKELLINEKTSDFLGPRFLKFNIFYELYFYTSDSVAIKPFAKLWSDHSIYCRNLPVGNELICIDRVH